ncbi:hypothetical protein [Scandinavium sp.]|uniref:hypothetical protein n=1 Tax=Scandinavium sp. TaxID=2830653 RepID=UPI0028A1C932|nr:hypothetical protein [Scandinavium sp.]
MAETDLKPGTNIARTKSKLLAGNTEKHEAVRKNNDRSLPEKAEPKVLRDMTVSYVITIAKLTELNAIPEAPVCA